MVRNILCSLALAGVASPLAAAPLTVRVVDASDRPVRDAVVTFYPAGADVSFPNLDPTKHHVYSFSQAKKFELKLFAKDQSRTVHFDKPGVIALGCNIHDQMSAFIVVTDSAWTARTNAQGIASFADAPNAPARLSIFHPYLRAPGGQQQQGVAASQRSVSFQIRLRPPPAMASMDY